MKRTVSDLLRQACLFAEQDREDFLASYEHMQDDPAYTEAKDFLDALRKYRLRRWGRKATEAIMDDAVSLKVF